MMAWFNTPMSRGALLIAYVFLTLGTSLAFRVADQDIAAKREKAIQKVCVETNKFRTQVNQQNDAFILHNDAAVQLFAKTAKELRTAEAPNFRRLAADYQAGSDYYRNMIAKMYTQVPLVDCDKLDVP